MCKRLLLPVYPLEFVNGSIVDAPQLFLGFLLESSDPLIQSFVLLFQLRDALVALFQGIFPLLDLSLLAA